MLSILAASLLAVFQSSTDSPAEVLPTPLQSVQSDAAALQGTVKSDFASNFLASTKDLPAIEGKRTVYWDRATRKALTPDEAKYRTEAELAIPA
ncbi:MAG: hypothetical protein ACI8TQ_001504 [Planctomycetota bacterium]|jgi:hypothetical protein